MHNLNTFVLAYLPYIIAYLNTSFLYFYTFIGIYLYISILAYTCILACTCIRAYLHSCILAYFLRGGVTKKNGIREKFPKGGGVKKTDENFQFQFGNFENPTFSKMSKLRIALRHHPK